jgi:uncharacterized membrane protein
MKPQFPVREHYSYQQHRKQRVTQIFLPMVIAVLVMIGMIVLVSLATFNSGGDVERWAAISTIWIILPVMLAGLILLALFIGLIYLMALALGALPHYTGLAQDYVYIARGYVIRAADMLVKPVIALNGLLENITAFFGRMTNR